MSWTQALHEYLLASPPQGAHEDAAQAWLCTPRYGMGGPNPGIASDLRAWLGQSSHLTHAHALSSALPHAEDFHRLGGPLLLWGMSRPWQRKILVKQTILHWWNVLNEPNLYSATLANNMAYATKLVVQMLPLLSKDGQRVVAQCWSESVMEKSPGNVLWQPNMYDAPTRAAVLASWADLHTIAIEHQGGLGTDKWETSVRRAFEKSEMNHGRNLLALLATDLSDDAKIRAARHASFNVWFKPDVAAQLLPLLQRFAPNPVERMYSLTWGPTQNFRPPQERAQLQKSLCSLYCPELVPLFEMYPIDWLDRVNVLKATSAFVLSNDHLDVAGLLDETPGMP